MMFIELWNKQFTLLHNKAQEIESDEIICNAILKDLCFMFKLHISYLLTDNIEPTFNLQLEYIE